MDTRNATHTYYPYRVMVQGELDDLTYWVMSPEGVKLDGYANASSAVTKAQYYYAKSREG